jgi:hypothetical protein
VADQHGGHGGDGIGLEQVGGHTGTVTHVVAHVVGDGGGVSGVVFGNPGFDLAHQVGAHVGTLGEDTTAQTGKDGDQAATETKGNQCDDVMGGSIVTGHGGQGQAGNDHTGDGAALEGHGKAGGHALFSRFSRPHVGQNGNPHADITGHKGGHGTEHEPESRLGAHRGKYYTKNNDTGDPHALQLAIQVGNGAFLDGACDGLHLLVSSRCTLDDTGKDNRKDNPGNADQRTNERYVVHYNVHSFLHSVFSVKSRFSVKPIHSFLCSFTKDYCNSLDASR